MPFAKPSPLIPPSAKPGPLIPPSAKPKSQTRRRGSNNNDNNKKTTRSKCTGSRKTCRRRELRRRATEKRRRQAKAAEKITASATSQSVEEASNSSYLSTNADYKEYMEQMRHHKGDEIGTMQAEIAELEDAVLHNEATTKQKELDTLIAKMLEMDQTVR